MKTYAIPALVSNYYFTLPYRKTLFKAHIWTHPDISVENSTKIYFNNYYVCTHIVYVGEEVKKKVDI